MKYWFLSFAFFVGSVSLCQSQKISEKELANDLKKIEYWRFGYNQEDTTISSNDSLEKYNKVFEKKLVSYLSSHQNSIAENFRSLSDSGLDIVTSQDGLLRIYTWNTWTGGTMRIVENICQYKIGGNVKIKILAAPLDDESDNGCYYWGINDIVSGGKKFYVTRTVSVFSSALSYHEAKIFSIQATGLNDDARLIKTATGIKNTLGYEVDRATKANADRELPDYDIQYDEANKIISIPVILDNGAVTAKRIKYQFKGKYFEKL